MLTSEIRSIFGSATDSFSKLTFLPIWCSPCWCCRALSLRSMERSIGFKVCAAAKVHSQKCSALRVHHQHLLHQRGFHWTNCCPLLLLLPHHELHHQPPIHHLVHCYFHPALQRVAWLLLYPEMSACSLDVHSLRMNAHLIQMTKRGYAEAAALDMV